MIDVKVPDYREQIAFELKRRQAVNPRYSMRSMARDLGITAAFLSGILSGKRALSVAKAAQICERLGYNPEQTSAFLSWVQASKAPASVLEARDLGDKLEHIEGRFVPVSLEQFQVVADWYHYAILELTYCPGFKPDPEWIARRLGIQAEEASRAIQRLLRTGLMKRHRGTYVKTDSYIAGPTDRPNLAIRAYHAQLLEKAKQALQHQEVARRDITGTTISFDSRQLPLIKKEIRKFHLRMAKLLETSKPDQVYHLAVQFFGLTAADTGNPGGVK